MRCHVRVKPPSGRLDTDLTSACHRVGKQATHTGAMRTFIVWTVAVALSLVLGVALYATSLRGSNAGFQQTLVSPLPTATVVKTEKKIVRKPPKETVVYVPQPQAVVPSSAAPAVSGDDHQDDSDDD